MLPARDTIHIQVLPHRHIQGNNPPRSNNRIVNILRPSRLSLNRRNQLRNQERRNRPVLTALTTSCTSLTPHRPRILRTRTRNLRRPRTNTMRRPYRRTENPKGLNRRLYGLLTQRSHQRIRETLHSPSSNRPQRVSTRCLTVGRRWHQRHLILNQDNGIAINHRPHRRSLRLIHTRLTQVPLPINRSRAPGPSRMNLLHTMHRARSTRPHSRLVRRPQQAAYHSPKQKMKFRPHDLRDRKQQHCTTERHAAVTTSHKDI